nr:hypothetical protein [Mycoplasmopsis bovis]
MSFAQADLLRRAISKKMKLNFINIETHFSKAG